MTVMELMQTGDVVAVPILAGVEEGERMEGEGPGKGPGFLQKAEGTEAKAGEGEKGGQGAVAVIDGAPLGQERHGP